MDSNEIIEKAKLFDEIQALKNKKRCKRLPEFTMKESKKLIIGLMAEVNKLTKDGEFKALIDEVQKAMKKDNTEAKLNATLSVIKDLNNIEDIDTIKAELSNIDNFVKAEPKDANKRDDIEVFNDIINFLLMKHERSFDTILSLIMQCTVEELQELPNLDVMENLVSFFSIKTYKIAFLKGLGLA